MSLLVLLVGLLAACGAGSLDSDGDGSDDASDCDPDDPAIYPGADDPENDGIDQNCDGEDGVFACDADGDGYAATDCSGNDCDDRLLRCGEGPRNRCRDRQSGRRTPPLRLGAAPESTGVRFRGRQPPLC